MDLLTFRVRNNDKKSLLKKLTNHTRENVELQQIAPDGIAIISSVFIQYHFTGLEDYVPGTQPITTTTMQSSTLTRTEWSSATPIDYSRMINLKESLKQTPLTPTENSTDLAADPELEAQLFKSASGGAGDSLAALELSVTVEGPEQIMPIRQFSEAKLAPRVLENMRLSKYIKPTAIQAYCIPAVLNGTDIVAVAQTGSGKTAAYLAPIVSELSRLVHKVGGPRADTKAENYDPKVNRVRAEPLAIIVCPTRELALQISQEARRLTYGTGLRSTSVYGGVPREMNLQELGKGCDIIVGTPGRLCDMLERQNVISLNRVKYTVIDEADGMLLDADKEEPLSKIMASGDANDDAGHCYLMFSATFPRSARKLAHQYLQEDFVRIRVGRAGSTHQNVTQQIIWTDQDAKQTALFDLLSSMEPGLTLIFCNAIAAVDRLDDFLYNKGMPTSFLHSGRSQYEREDSLRDFFNNKNPILITTALAARGIDFHDVRRVINYDLPSKEYGGIEEYVHRIGRTGRIGHKGLAISFYNDDNQDIGQDLVNLLLETNQEVPEFLESYKPTEGEEVNFDDESEDEDDAAGAGGDGGAGWGGAEDSAGLGDAGAASSGAEAGGWGSTNETAVEAW